MPAEFTVHLHCFSSDDAPLLPHLFRRYDAWVDHYHVWDFSSADGSLAQLASNPRVTLHPYEADGRSIVNIQRTRFDSAWQISRGQADWVVVLHADEHLHHPDFLGYLRHCKAEGVTAVRTIGYEMVSPSSPAQLDAQKLLAEQVTQGCRSPGLDRLAIFSPSALRATNFSPGQHHAWPEGHVVWPASAEVLLLRFQLLGDPYVFDKHRSRAAALLPDDTEHGWASHLMWTAEELQNHVATLRARAQTVPGLGDLASMDPRSYRGDEKIVEAFGLLDRDWYEQQYSDVAANQFDALAHFCHYGWKEGRRPNPYFDTSWYARTYAAELEPERNPLVHYIERGERENAWPSPHFDPEWYRDVHSLQDKRSPLAHYLQLRFTGQVSPIPGFDPQAYLQSQPALGQGVDPFLHMLEKKMTEDNPLDPAQQTDDAAEAGVAALPTWDSFVQAVGGEPETGDVPQFIALDTVKEALKPFITWLPFDADWYLNAHPDVAEAMAVGAFESAHAHFIDHGFFEGRAAVPNDTLVPPADRPAP